MSRKNSFYILQVSDFHITDEKTVEETARAALKAVSDKLKEQKIQVKYLIHTGDVISQQGIQEQIQVQGNSEYNEHLDEIVSNRFNIAQQIMDDFIKDLGVSNKNVVICCGNHDKCRYKLESDEIKKPEKKENTKEDLFFYFNKFINYINDKSGYIQLKKRNNLDVLALDINIEKKGDKDSEKEVKENQDLKPFYYFNKFIKHFDNENEHTQLKKFDDLEVLVLNTNIEKKGDNKKEIACIYSDTLKIAYDEINKHDDEQDWFYSGRTPRKNLSENDKVYVVVAHQPLYDICETIRLPYDAESQTTDFVSTIQDFIRGNGFYLCGDKHTSSIIASNIHDIPHYLCGHPFITTKNTSSDIENKKETQNNKQTAEPTNNENEPGKTDGNCEDCKGMFCHKNDSKNENVADVEIDYNLIEIRGANKTGKRCRVHLEKIRDEWTCSIRPIDATISSLYKNSESYLVKECFTSLALQTGTKHSSWVNLSWRNIFNKLDSDNAECFQKLSNFFRLFAKLKDYNGNVFTIENKDNKDHQESGKNKANEENKESGENKTCEKNNDSEENTDSKENENREEVNNIFKKIEEIIEESLNRPNVSNMENVLNIRGEYGSGKSTFIGLLYIYLMYRYSCGELNFIPAYFNMENDYISAKIQDGSKYAAAVKKTFYDFVNEVEKISEIEDKPVCYLIDGLDEQDIWSESSEDSVGRVALNILAETRDTKYIMSFSQNKLARFKNTMPPIKYYERSYVLYFNPVYVDPKMPKECQLYKFVNYILVANEKLRKAETKADNNSKDAIKQQVIEDKQKEENLQEDKTKSVCKTITKFRRLHINLEFIYQNYSYIKECDKNEKVSAIYRKYIEQQHKICENMLKYNFTEYAPAMAYFYTYEGYTYERFKNIAPGTVDHWEKKILENSSKIYKTFIFIKKYKDAREYLIALHYNRELRYFTENPKLEIPENSIINRMLSRNISIIAKKLWKGDPNKFIIVNKGLIEKRKLIGSQSIKSCTLSTLTYILAYLNEIPNHNRAEIEAMLYKAGGEMLNNSEQTSIWKISGDSPTKMQKFIDLSFWHSQEVIHAIDSNNSLGIVRKLIEDPDFSLYNRQYMMWYYGDLTICGEHTINNLIPGTDKVYHRIDYYNCFSTLYHKLYAYYNENRKHFYPLLEFDLYTICDLVYNRKPNDEEGVASAYCVGKIEKAVYKNAKWVLEKYVNSLEPKEDEGNGAVSQDDKSDTTDKQYKYEHIPFERIKEKFKVKEYKTDEEYVEEFFKSIFKKLQDKNEEETTNKEEPKV